MKRIITIMLMMCLMLFSAAQCIFADEVEATKIYTTEDLNKIRDNLGGNYILMNDIVFDTFDFEEGGSFYNDGQGWLPIGDSENGFFKGTLDGNGYTIQNLTITADSEGAYGLFSYNSGVIKNLGMVNTMIDVDVTNPSETDSSASAGSIAGKNKGTISSCYNTGKVKCCITNGEFGCSAGGIVSGNSGTIENCYNAASVYAGRTYKYASSSAGGIAADTKGASIKQSYNTGMVSVGYKGYYSSVAYGISNNMKSPDIDTCYSIDNVQKGRRVSSKHYDCTYVSEDSMRDSETYKGFDFDNVWIMDDKNGYPYPQLRSVNYKVILSDKFAGGSGASHDPFVIKTAEQLQMVQENLGAYYKLGADIDLSSYEKEWDPLGESKYDAFFGLFDGAGYVVRNLNISRYAEEGQFVGLFGYSDGIITDLGAVNGTVELNIKITTETQNKYFYAGGMAGKSIGVLERCYNTNNVIFRDENSVAACYTYVGGLAGAGGDNCQIKDCYNNGSLYAESKKGFVDIGGISGNYGVIENCYNVGDVVLVDDSSAEAMSISGTSSKCINCYTLPIGTGRYYETSNDVNFIEEGQMKNEETFKGFDFSKIWTFEKEGSYPCPVLKSTKHVDFDENFTEFAGGRGTWYSPYKISTSENLKNVELYPEDCFVLQTDITVSEEDWSPIGKNSETSFKGRFDGNGKSIAGLNIKVESGEKYTGLFGYNSGEVKNIILEDSNIYVDEGFTGSAYIGTVSGFQASSGSITGCRIINSSIESSVSDIVAYIGGAVGYNYGQIRNASFDGEIYADYIGETYGSTGGITGYNYEGKISSCYNSANISGNVDKTTTESICWGGITGYNRTDVYDVFNTGDMSVNKAGTSNGSVYVAGIIGYNNLSSYKYVENAYSTGKASLNGSIKTPIMTGGSKYYVKNTYYTQGGSGSSYTGTKLSEQEMKTKESLTGFDFDGVWMITDETDAGFEYAQLQAVPYDTNYLNKSLTDSIVVYENLYPHTGNAITPKAEVYFDSKLLDEGTDYKLSYENNVDPGNATIIITGTGDYVGAKKVDFTIKDYDISHMEVTLGGTAITYNGSEKKPQVIISGLYEGSDFTVTYDDNINVGTATATIVGCGDYHGKVIKTYEIVPATITATKVKLEATNFGYTGNAIEPEVSIYISPKTLVKDKDFTVTYSNNVDVGTGTVIVEGINNYSGSVTKEFVIEPVDASEFEAVVNVPNYTYDGLKKKPAVTIKTPEGDKLTEGSDYTVDYGTGNYKIGKHNANVTFIGNYKGSQTVSFEIGPKNPSSVVANLYGYDDVKVSWKKVTGATGYKLYYKEATASEYTFFKKTTGTYCNVVNLKDGVKYNFKVIAYKTVNGNVCENTGVIKSLYTLKKIATPTVSKNGTKVKVKWTNINGETGYQISKSTKKTGTNIVSTYKTTKGTYKNISATKGKTYYYKVRAYKVVDGKKVYGPWSAVKSYKRK